MNDNKKGIENPTLLTQLMKLLEKCAQIMKIGVRGTDCLAKDGLMRKRQGQSCSEKC